MDKSNVMETGALWRRRVSVIADEEYRDVDLEHLLADAFLCALVQQPARFDVVLGDNLFGDLISDAAAPIAGSLGMLPSASLGPPDANGRRRALYEPVHGSAPDIAGKGLANPCGAVLSVAMMTEWTFGLPDLARRIEHAVDDALVETGGTSDLGGSAKPAELLDAILAGLA